MTFLFSCVDTFVCFVPVLVIFASENRFIRLTIHLAFVYFYFSLHFISSRSFVIWLLRLLFSTEKYTMSVSFLSFVKLRPNCLRKFFDLPLCAFAASFSSRLTPFFSFSSTHWLAIQTKKFQRSTFIFQLFEISTHTHTHQCGNDSRPKQSEGRTERKRRA